MAVRESLRSAAGILANVRLNGSSSTAAAARALLRTVRYAGEPMVSMLAARALCHVIGTGTLPCLCGLCVGGRDGDVCVSASVR